MKRFRLLIFLLLFYSCNSNKTKTFLDFYFGMTPSEYYDHVLDLTGKKIVTLKPLTNTNIGGLISVALPSGGNEFDVMVYEMKLPKQNGGEFDFLGEVRGDIVFDGNDYPMKDITYNFTYNTGLFLNKNDYDQLKITLAEKYGNFSEYNPGGIYYATWDKGDYAVQLIVDERPDYRKAELFYYAKGDLEKTLDKRTQEIKDKDKNKNKVDNNY